MILSSWHVLISNLFFLPWKNLSKNKQRTDKTNKTTNTLYLSLFIDLFSLQSRQALSAAQRTPGRTQCRRTPAPTAAVSNSQFVMLDFIVGFLLSNSAKPKWTIYHLADFNSLLTGPHKQHLLSQLWIQRNGKNHPRESIVKEKVTITFPFIDDPEHSNVLANILLPTPSEPSAQCVLHSH